MARRKSKDTIANDLYGEDFEYCSSGQKATVTKKFDAQASTSRPVAGATSILSKIGRVGNGVKEQVMSKGDTVADLISQAKFSIDENKESVIAQSTGLSVNLSTLVRAGEVYVITPEIKSAE